MSPKRLLSFRALETCQEMVTSWQGMFRQFQADKDMSFDERVTYLK